MSAFPTPICATCQRPVRKFSVGAQDMGRVAVFRATCCQGPKSHALGRAGLAAMRPDQRPIPFLAEDAAMLRLHAGVY